MILIDYIIIGILIASCLFSFIKGFFQELISLFFWIIGFYISINYYSFFSKYFFFIHNKILKNFIVLLTLFMLFMITESISKYAVTELVLKLGCNQTNKILGIIFGLIKGIILISLAILILNTFTSFSHSYYYKKSIVIPYFNYFIKKILIFVKNKYL